MRTAGTMATRSAVTFWRSLSPAALATWVRVGCVTVPSCCLY
ncbi:MAG: hypothetical protein WAT67_01420 [Candidatus Contendobacter sp.]